MSFKSAILTHDLKGSWWSDFAQKSTYYAIVRNSVLRRVENIIIHFIRQSISHEKNLSADVLIVCRGSGSSSKVRLWPGRSGNGMLYVGIWL